MMISFFVGQKLAMAIGPCVRAGGGSERVVGRGREGGQTVGLGDVFIGDHVSNLEGRFTVYKTEYLFI